MRAFAGRLGLTVSRAARVRKGKLRATYQVETPRGRIAVKVARAPDGLRLEARAIDALRRAGFERVPRMLAPVDRVNDLFFVGYEWIDGFSAKPLAADARIDRSLARSIGGAVRELDDALAELEPFTLPTLSAWEAVLRDSIGALVEARPPLPRPLDTDLAEVALALVSDGTLARTRPVHGDIRFGNLVFDGRGRIRAFLDFEHVKSATAKLESAVAVRNLFSVETLANAAGARLDLANGLEYLLGYDADLGRRVRESGWAELRRELILAILDEIRFVIEMRDRLQPGRLPVLMNTATSQLAWAVRL